jgi:endonuclease YncB( thermonuclease family)
MSHIFKYKYIIFSLLILLIGCRTNSNSPLSVKQPIKYGNLIVQNIISIYDGDTIRVNLTSTNKLHDIISKNISVRLIGIDTPEIRGSSKRLKKLAIESRDYLEYRLRNSKIIILKDIQRGMYFRILATVEADGVNINHELVELGLAKWYDGGSKKGLW